MCDAYVLATMDNGVKKYFTCDKGWQTSDEDACWFDTLAGAENQAFDEGLEDDEIIIEERSF